MRHTSQDDGEALDNGQSADSNEHFVFTAPAACSSLCTYYVVVRGWDNSSNNYDIRIAVQ